MNADVIVIGGGPGGYVAAIKSAINGKKVILIEKDQVGGTCLNRGCIPTKALIHCADVLDTVKGSSACGIEVSDYQIDTKKVNDYKNSVVKKLVGGVSYLLNKRGVQVIQGSAAFSGIKELTVTRRRNKECSFCRIHYYRSRFGECKTSDSGTGWKKCHYKYRSAEC